MNYPRVPRVWVSVRVFGLDTHAWPGTLIEGLGILEGPGPGMAAATRGYIHAIAYLYQGFGHIEKWYYVTGYCSNGGDGYPDGWAHLHCPQVQVQECVDCIGIVYLVLLVHHSCISLQVLVCPFSTYNSCAFLCIHFVCISIVHIFVLS